MNCWKPLDSPDGHNVAGNGKRDGSKTVRDWAISSQAPVETQVKVQRLGSRPTAIAMDKTYRLRLERVAPHVGEDIVHAGVKASGKHEQGGGSL